MKSRRSWRRLTASSIAADGRSQSSAVADDATGSVAEEGRGAARKAASIHNPAAATTTVRGSQSPGGELQEAKIGKFPA